VSAPGRSRQTRYLSAAVGIPLGLGVCLFLPVVFNLLVIGFMIIGMVEFFGVARSRGLVPHRFVGILCAVAISLVAWTGRPVSMLYALVASMIVIYTVAMARNSRDAMANIGVTIFGIFYVGWFCSHVILLRRLPLDGDGTGIDLGGAGYVIMLLILLWLGDGGAFFAGIGWGRHKLLPAISPNKTIEGAVGGLILTIVGAVLIQDAGRILTTFGILLFPDVSYTGCVLVGTGIAVAGQIGDLCESYIKRDAGVKDTGNLFPGHGGFLDRFDSLLFSAPLFYYFLKFVYQ
jgi:phosphatidate cytidylyltransferase